MMGKMKDVVTNPNECTLCGMSTPYELTPDQNTGYYYCSDKCRETDQMISNEDYYKDQQLV